MAIKISHTWGLQIVCEYLARNKLLILQLVNRRFYLNFVAAILRPLSIFTRRGLQIMRNSGCVQVFSATRLEWDQVFVHQVG